MYNGLAESISLPLYRLGVPGRKLWSDPIEKVSMNMLLW